MANIAVDIDSTLYDFDTPAREGFLKLAEKYDDETLFRGAYEPWTEWRSPADACGLDRWLEVIAEVHRPEVILSREPFPGAVGTCQALEAEGHELMFISARDGSAEEATERWLRDKGFLEQNAEVLCSHDKAQHMAECQYLIDDRPKTAINFVTDFNWQLRFRANDLVNIVGNGKRKAFLLMYPYNAALTDAEDMYLAPTWAGINYYLVRKGVLSAPAYTALEV
jgi:hypothetical protein